MKKAFFVPVLIMAATGLTSEAQASSYSNSDYCREYTRTIYVGGKPQQGYGTACQQADGSWKIISGDNVGQTIAPTYFVEQPVVYYQEPVRNVYRTSYYAPRPAYSSLSISIGSRGGHDWNRGHGKWRGNSYGHRNDYKHTRRSGNRLSWR